MLTTTSPAPRTFLTAAWRHLVVFNYEVDPALLESYIPAGTQLDFDPAGKTYISIVGFVFEETRVLGWKIPWHVNFAEVNLRFYVRREEPHEVRRGVVFIKELVSRPAISFVARWGYNENYYTVPMRHSVTPYELTNQTAPQATYAFRHRGQWLRIAALCQPHSFLPAEDSHEAFILEHYWGYCRQRDGGTIEYRVEHPRWHVWPVETATMEGDFSAVYGREFGQVLSQPPTTAFFANGSEISVARPRRVQTQGHYQWAGN